MLFVVAFGASIVGAVCGIGGILGKGLFSALQQLAAQPDVVGGYQAVCLAAVTAVALICTLKTP